MVEFHTGELLPAEANTGVLALADSPTTRWLLKAWEAAYVKLSELGQLMDQPAFRAALHLTRDRLRFVHLDAAYNCRGRDTARKNSVRISCDGYHDYENYLQKSLEAVPKPNLQPDFNVSVFERFGPDSFTVLRDLDESDRSVQKSAESTLI